RRTGKLQTPDHGGHGLSNRDQILEVGAKRYFVTECVIAADQFAKPLPPPSIGDTLDREGSKSFHPPAQRHHRFALGRVRNRGNRPHRTRLLFPPAFATASAPADLQ